MNNYLKLVSFEWNRFFKVYFVLVLITIISQIAGTIVQARSYLTSMNRTMEMTSISSELEYVREYGEFYFGSISQSMWFIFPVFLSMITLLIYTLFIWYRDWLGKNTFIYRLLMLPTSRLNILLAKTTTIFIMVLGLVALQLILLYAQQNIIQVMIPVDLRETLSITEMIRTFDYMRVLYPITIFDFTVYYGTGLLLIIIIFTAILMERSFRWKGIILGLIYITFSLLVFFSQMLVTLFTGEVYLYPLETMIVQIVLGLLVFGMSLGISNYLLKKKVTI